MDNNRKLDLSVFYWLQTFLPGFVTVLDAFPNQSNTNNPQLTLPTVSIDALKLSDTPFELGSINKLDRFWAIDVFAKNKSQRDDFAYEIVNRLENESIPVYDYDQGFPPIVVPIIGYAFPETVVATSIYVFQDLVQNLYWRTRITFFTKFTEV